MNSNENPCYGIFWVLAETESDIVAENVYAIKRSYSLDNNSCSALLFPMNKEPVYNHKRTWETLPHKVTRGKSFDYYPRGRVELKNDKTTIWLNHNVSDLIDAIKSEYRLNSLSNVKLRVDGSSHYKCHFDYK